MRIKSILTTLIAVLFISVTAHAQLPAPTFTSTEYNFCDGDELVFELTGFPDPATFGNADGMLVIQLSWQTANECLGSSVLSGTITQTITSSTATFSTGDFLDLTHDFDFIKTNVSYADPFNEEGALELIVGQNGSQCAQIRVYPIPDASLSLPVASPSDICEGDGFDVVFNATAGNGPFNITINGVGHMGITDGSTLTLIEGIDFTSDAASIELTSITDTNGGNHECSNSGAPLSLVFGPNVIELDPGIIVQSGNLTICDTNVGADRFDGDGTNGSSMATESSISGPGATITYQWQYSTDGFATFTTLAASGNSYNPPGFSMDRTYRRKAIATIGSTICELFSNEVEITVNNVIPGSLSGTGQIICPSTDASVIQVTGESGDGVLSYQWSQSADDITFTPIPGAESDSYIPTNLEETTYYRLEVTSTLDGIVCSDLTPSIDVQVSVPAGTNGTIENTSLTTFHCTIQEAIDNAVSENTIEVPAGTYEENIVINKALAINGANAGVVCGSRAAEAILAPISGTPVTISADGVTLNGFEITAPDAFYAVNFGGTSNTTVSYNNIHDIGTNKTGGGNVHALLYTVGSSNTSTVAVTDNCLNNISSSSLSGFSASAIGILQSTSTGELSGLAISGNTIDNVQVNTGDWPTGKIAYGVQINVGGGSGYLTTTGKVLDAVISDNTISNLSGFISTGIGLEGNTENGVITGNIVSTLFGRKSLGDRASGAYDLQALKFENNRYVGTCTVETNSFRAETFTHDVTPELGYSIANYVAVGQAYTGGTTSALVTSCNWHGSALYEDIQDNSFFTGKTFNKAGASTSFTPFWTTISGTCDGDGPVKNIDTGESWGTIQEGIDAPNTLNSHTLTVASGTYDENIVINKALTINGANAGVACGSRSAEAILAPISGTPVTISADGVTLNGFEITAPDAFYAVNFGGTSNTTVSYNNIHDIGTNKTGGGNVHALLYTVGSSNTSTVAVTDNCLNNISSSSLSGFSASAIGILQSTSTGELSGLAISGNTIDNVQVNTGDWPTGKIAYGVQINVGGGSGYLTTTGKVLDAVISDNTISNLSGFISTGIGLEGNTENGVITGNIVSTLFGRKSLGDRASGAYDLQALKFENNRYVGTCTVETNSFRAETFTHDVTPELGYSIANYVAVGQAYTGGTTSALVTSCNWHGSALYGDIQDNSFFTGKTFNKAGASTSFIPFWTTISGTCDGDGPVKNIDTGESWGTIQEGIDAPNTLGSHTLTVASRTYEENIVINKALTINGANAGVVCGSRAAEAILAPISGTPVTISADGVTLNGFEITAPDAFYAVNFGGTSNTTVSYNNIHDIGTNKTGGGNVHALLYTVGSSNTSTVAVTDNCLNNISSSSLSGFSASAIGILQSTSTGELSGLAISGNTIDNVQVNTGDWPTGKIAYGVQINVGGGSGYLTTTGKVLDAVISDNTISNLSGFISTGIGLEGNTENGVITGNIVSTLFGRKSLGDRASGAYDLQALKFENNRYVGTCTVETNSFRAETFTHDVTPELGYSIANYVAVGQAYTGGTTSALVTSCNWHGSALYEDIQDNSFFTGKTFNKAGASTSFTPFWTTISGTCDGDGPVKNIDTGESWGTIQEGIDAPNTLNSHTLTVASGTYDENIVINKALTINGANAGQDCSTRTAAEAVIAPTTGLPVNITADVVTLNGFEITAPDHNNAVALSNRSNVTVSYNNIHDIGTNLTGGGNIHAIVNQIGSSSSSNVTIANNCLNTIGNSGFSNNSLSAIGILQSASTGILTGLTIADNVIDNLNVNTATWPVGKIAYGIQINVGGGAGYLSTTGKVVDATISGNSITTLEGFISTGIALEGNTENAVVTLNSVSNLTGHKLGSRAGGGYDLNGLKFENNRYVGTVTVANNSFEANTFVYGPTSTAGLGYAVANYVPMAVGGVADLSCNWFGTANYGEIVAEYTAFTGKVFNKEGAGTDFIEYLTNNTIDPGAAGYSCAGVHADLANLSVSYTEASENVVVTFDVTDNSTMIYPIPDLDPTDATDFAEIVARYAALESALSGGVAEDIEIAALDLGDDIITEYYYLDGGLPVYLQTAEGNDLIKSKYWNQYLNNTTSGNRYPDFGIGVFEVPSGNYSTSTNPNTGGTVDATWLAAVYGKDLYIRVTLVHNGTVTRLTETVAIGAAPVVNEDTELGYLTIQSAIDAASTVNGHTITVSSGTYAENVVINKGIILNGTNADVACGTNAASIISPLTGTAVSITADGVTLNGFEINGPDAFYAISLSNTSNTTIKHNLINDIGTNLTGGGNIHAIVNQIGSSNSSNVTISNNCIENIGSSSFSNNSLSAIGILQSASTGVLTGLTIADNVIDNLNVNTATWPVGKIAYGIQINVGGGAGYLSTTGKVVDATISGNSITTLEGFISTGIALEGNTENAVVTLNSVSNLTGHKLGSRAGGGYDLNGLKFENNRYVSTVTVENNSFEANTFTYGPTSTSDLGYAIANYVSSAEGGAATLNCNWFGTANYNELVAEYTNFTGKIFTKEGAGTQFIEYLTNSTIDTGDPSYSCSGIHAGVNNLVLTYTEASENVVVTFNAIDNSTMIYPIPGLDPAVPADLAEIVAIYNAFGAALASGVSEDIREAALNLGDDIFTEYYFYDNNDPLTGNLIYLQTAGGNDLIKNKYWDQYLNNQGNGDRYPDSDAGLFEVPIAGLSTSTNPNTGGAVNTGWLSPVLGKNLHVRVTHVHNGNVQIIEETVAIGDGPVRVYTDATETTLVSSHYTIQAAIDAATTMDGYVVRVDAGTYSENVTVTKELDIRGPNYGINPNTGTRVAEAIITPDATVNLATPESDFSAVITVNAENVSIDGFRVTGDNGVVASNYVGLNIQAGVGIRGNESNLTVSHNVVDRISSLGISTIRSLGNVNTLGPINNVTITDNLLEEIHDIRSLGFGFAMYVQGSNGIVDNNVVRNSRNGLQIQPYGAIGGGTVSNNDIQCYNLGIWYNYASSGSGSWTVETNTILGINPPAPITGGTGLTWSGIAVQTMEAGGGSAIFSDNAIDGGLVTSTSLDFEAVIGYRVRTPNDNATDINTFTENSITNVETFINNETTQELNATCNFYGTEDAGNILSSVTGNVDFLPFLVLDNVTGTIQPSWSSDKFSCEGAGLVKLYTDNTFSTLINSFNVIQEAIDAASSGNAITVDAGTFAEALTVNKDLEIYGPNVSVAGNGARNAEAIISDGGLDILGNNTVVFEGFKFAHVSNSTPISLGGSAVATIENNIIERVGTATVPGGPQSARGIEISNGTGIKLIKNNLFTGDPTSLFSGTLSWNSGMFINGPVSTINVEGNTFENCRTALNIDDMGAGITLNDNTFTNNGTHIAFGGTSPTNGQYVLGANNFNASGSAFVNLSNVTEEFRLDITSSSYEGVLMSALTNEKLFEVEAQMYHKDRNGRKGKVTYVANNQYVNNFSIPLSGGGVFTKIDPIQSSVKYADDNDIINLQAGTYNQAVTVDHSNVTIQGITSDKLLYILDGAGLGANGTGVGSRSGFKILGGETHVAIKNLTIENFVGAGGNSDAGIYAISGNDNLAVDNIQIQSLTTAHGFYANGPINTVSITNSMITDIGSFLRGIVIWNGFKQNITITGNTLTNNSCCGIELQDGTSSAVNISDNEIEIGSGDNAIAALGMNDLTGPNMINDNIITGGGRYGIEIKNPNGGVTVSGNSITMTVQNGDVRDRVGIAVMRRDFTAGNPSGYVDIPNGVSITNNTVEGYQQAAGADEGFGIVVEGTDHEISGNNLIGNDVGIQLQGGGHANANYVTDDAGSGSQNAGDSPDYFGRGNSPIVCNVTLGTNSFTTNSIDYRLATNDFQTSTPRTITDLALIEDYLDKEISYAINGVTIANINNGSVDASEDVVITVCDVDDNISSTLISPNIANLGMKVTYTSITNIASPPSDADFKVTTYNALLGLPGNNPGSLRLDDPTLPGQIISTIEVYNDGNDNGVLDPWECIGDVITLTVNVGQPTVMDDEDDQLVCAGEAVQTIEFSSSVAGTIFNWTNDNTAIGLAAVGSGNIGSFTAANTTSQPLTATITVTPEYTEGGVTCIGEAIQFVITVLEDEGAELSCIDDIEVDNDPGECSAVVSFSAPAAYDPQFHESFENPAFEMNTPASWIEFNATINAVASGTNGINSTDGTNYGVIDPSLDAQTGVFSRLGGYTTDFGTGFRTKTDVYINLDDSRIIDNTYGWDLSSAVNGQDGNHQRDYIFHTASDANGHVLVGGSNNTNGAPRSDLATLNHYSIESTGWYTFEFVYRDAGDGSLAVDLNLRDASGTLLFTETRNNAADIIATEVGGNRYMWFVFVEAESLAIDNTQKASTLETTCSFESGDVFPVGETTVTCSVTDACGNVGSCSFTVTVIDNVAPTAVCQDVTVQIGSAGVGTLEASMLDDGSTDNCGPVSLGILGSPEDLAFDQNVTSDVIFGTGNGNGAFTVGNGSNVELGLRAKVRFPVPTGTYNSQGDGSYNHLAGPFGNDNLQSGWNFEWSVNTDQDGTSGQNLDALTYELGLDFDPTDGVNYVVFDPINVPYADHSIGNNSTGNSAGTEAADETEYNTLIANNNLAQNSWRHNFFGSFDGNVEGRYDVYLKAYDSNGDEVATTAITVIVGAGTGSAYAGSFMPLDSKEYTCSDVGSFTETLVAIDASGNSSTCAATVTVEDIIAPIVACQDVTVQLDENGVGTLLVSDVDNGSDDNCSFSLGILGSPEGLNYDQNITSDIIFGDGNANGFFAVDTENGVELGLRAKVRYPTPANTFNSNGDGSYNHAAGSFGTGGIQSGWNFEWSINTDQDGTSGQKLDGLTYELGLDFDPTDDVSFQIFDPINLPYADHAIGNNSTINGEGTVASDGTEYATLLADNNLAQNSWRHNFFGAFDGNVEGRYDVYLKAFDSSGNEVAATAITVIVGTGTGSAYAGSLMLLGSKDYDCNEVGINTETLLVVDASGNASTCTATVTVEDNVAPEVVCQDVTVQLDANGVGTLLASELNNGSDDNCAFSIGILGSPEDLAYDQNVTSDVIFGSGNGNGAFTVVNGSNVELGLRAKVRFPVPSGTYNSNGNGSYSHLAGAFGGDGMQSGWNFEWSINTDQDGNSGQNLDALTYELGLDFDPTDGVDFLVFDPINVPYADHAIGDNSTGNGNGSVAASGNLAEYAGLIAGNNLAQNSWRHNFFGTFDGNIDGRYEVYLKAFDSNGDEVAATAITVIVGTGTGIAYAGSLMPLGSIEYDCSDVGVFTETLLVIDGSSNSSTCTASVTVEDNVSPTFMNCPGDDVTCTADLPYTWTHPSLADNCNSGTNTSLNYQLSGATTSGLISVVSFDGTTTGSEQLNPGVTIITYTANDENGNETSNTCSFTVTTYENPSPTIDVEYAVWFDSNDNIAESSITGDSYAWSIVNGDILTDPTQQQITYAPTNGNPIELSLTVTSDGCSTEVLESVEVLGPCDPLDFSESLIHSDNLGAGVWSIDRFEPAEFASQATSPDGTMNVLLHQISSADGQTNGFLNTQGKKTEVYPQTMLIEAQLYIPTSWENSGRRMAGLWGTAYDASNAISAYPIIEFTSDNANPRFRGFDGDGTWLDLQLPGTFQYDQWVTIRIELLSTAEFRYIVETAQGEIVQTSLAHGVYSSVRFDNIILQGHNTTAGVDYDIYWNSVLTTPVDVNVEINSVEIYNRDTFDICQSDLIEFLITGNPGDNYELYKDGVLINSGTLNATYELSSSIDLTDEGGYHLDVVGVEGCATDFDFFIDVKETPIFSVEVNGETANSNSDPMLSICDESDVNTADLVYGIEDEEAVFNVNFDYVNVDPASFAPQGDLTVDGVDLRALFENTFIPLSLTNKLTYGSLVVTVTPYYDINENGTIEIGTDCVGEDVVITINVEPIPLMSLVHADDSGNNISLDNNSLPSLLEVCSGDMVSIEDVVTPTTANMGVIKYEMEVLGDIANIGGSPTTDIFDFTTTVPFSGTLTNTTSDLQTLILVFTPFLDANDNDIIDDGECINGDIIQASYAVHPEPTSENSTQEACTQNEFIVELENNLTNINVANDASDDDLEIVTFTWSVSSINPALPMVGVDLTSSSANPGSHTLVDYDFANTITNPYTIPVTVTYEFVPFSTNGCEGDPFYVDVTVNKNPDVSVNPNGTTNLCEDEERVLLGFVTPTGSYSYQWEIIEDAANAPLTNPSILEDATTISPLLIVSDDIDENLTIRVRFTATDNNTLCSDETELVFTVSEQPSATVVNLTKCETQTNDGTAVFNLTNGVSGVIPAATSVVSYHTSEADALTDVGAVANATTFTGVDGQQVYVRVENGGCAIVYTMTLNVDGLPEFIVDTEDVSCNGNIDGAIIVTVTSGSAPFMYSKDGGTTYQSSNTFADLDADSYSIVVQDANSCTSEPVVVIIDQNDELSAIGVGELVACNGDLGTASVTVSGGTGLYTYSWEDSANTVVGTTASVSGLAAGTYAVTVEDANGCTAVASATISEPALLEANATGIEVACNGDMGSGAVSANPVGGTGPYTYNWEDSNMQFVSSNSSVSGLDVGTYSLTVTDENGCTALGTAEVTEPSALTLAMTGDALSCNGDMDGEVSVVVSGGTENGGSETATEGYQYLWSTGATTSSVTGLLAGTYTVTVTDDNGCTAESSAEVTEPSAITAGAMIENVNCNGGMTGSLSLTVNGGTGAYGYLWTSTDGIIPVGQETMQNLSGLTAGTYEVAVTDANNCEITASYEITEPTAIVITITDTNETCEDADDGEAVASASGGVGPYVYNWDSNLLEGDTASGLSGGQTYIVTVEDANGCTSTASVTIATDPVEPFVISNCPSDITLQVQDCGISYNWLVPTYANNCEELPLTLNLNGATNEGLNNDVQSANFPVGSTLVEYIDNSGPEPVVVCSFTVTVEDPILPTIVCPATITVSCYEDVPAPFMNFSEFLQGGGVLSDNCNVDFGSFSFESETESANGLCVNNRTISRIYSVFDENGNSSTCERIIEVLDETGPVIAVPSDTIVNCNQSLDPVDLGGAVAEDLCSEVVLLTFTDVSTQGSDPNSCDFYSYEVTRTWTAIDECGNVTEADQIIEVQDTTAPVIVADDVTINLNNDDNLETLTFNDLDDGTADNCSPLSTTSISIENFDCSNLGENIVVLTATDVCGNTGTATITVTIEQSNIVTNATDNQQYSLRDIIDNNCLVDTVTFSPALSGISQVVDSQIQLPDGIVIDGTSAANIIVSGGNLNRIFFIPSTNSVEVIDMTLADGEAAVNGGALFNEGTIILRDMILSGNTENGQPKALSSTGTVIIEGEVLIED